MCVCWICLEKGEEEVSFEKWKEEKEKAEESKEKKKRERGSSSSSPTSSTGTRRGGGGGGRESVVQTLVMDRAVGLSAVLPHLHAYRRDFLGVEVVAVVRGLQVATLLPRVTGLPASLLSAPLLDFSVGKTGGGDLRATQAWLHAVPCYLGTMEKDTVLSSFEVPPHVFSWTRARSRPGSQACGCQRGGNQRKEHGILFVVRLRGAMQGFSVFFGQERLQPSSRCSAVCLRMVDVALSDTTRSPPRLLASSLP